MCVCVCRLCEVWAPRHGKRRPKNGEKCYANRESDGEVCESFEQEEREGL